MQGATSAGGQEPAVVTSAWLSEPGLQLSLAVLGGGQDILISHVALTSEGGLEKQQQVKVGGEEWQ